MAIAYGQKGTRIMSGHINSIALLGTTVLEQSDVNGGFEIKVQHNSGGDCGSTAVLIQVQDFVPWTKISAEFWTTGSAACWSFMDQNGYGTTSVGQPNIYTFDANAGDKCVKTYLAQNDSPYDTHNKSTGCDNDANNFMRYNTTTFRKCTFVRRRIGTTPLAGIHHGRACNEVGANAITIIKNIYVW